MSNDGNIIIKGLNVTIEGTNTKVIGTSVAALGKNGANPGVKVDGNVTIKGGKIVEN